MLHAWSTAWVLAPPLALWLLDRALRLRQSARPVHLLEARPLPGGVVRLALRDPALLKQVRARPGGGAGSFVMLACRDTGSCEVTPPHTPTCTHTRALRDGPHMEEADGPVPWSRSPPTRDHCCGHDPTHTACSRTHSFLDRGTGPPTL